MPETFHWPDIKQSGDDFRIVREFARAVTVELGERCRLFFCYILMCETLAIKIEKTFARFTDV